MDNMTVRFIIAVIIAYLLGSLNFSIIISKLTMKKDIRDFGSGNAGTTNSLRVMGMKKTVFVLLGDILKGVAAIFIASRLVYDANFAILRSAASIACILGHTYPVFFKFRGGKGVLTTAAVIGSFNLPVCLIAVSVFVIIVAITRYVSLGSIIAIWTVPFLFMIFEGFSFDGVVYIILGTVIAAFVTYLHRSNIKRLVAGNENKLKFKK